MGTTAPLPALLDRLAARRDLTEAEADGVMTALANPSVPPALAGALLVALRTKGETADEVRGFAKALRRLAHRPLLAAAQPGDGPLVDVCGTGGDGSGSLNLSTGSALLAAAAGLRVVKHGNRSISSRSGSADVLEALGIPANLGPDAAGACLSRTGFVFLFAPSYHPALGVLAPVRKALGVRTVCNLLGPLVNPATPPFQVIGAFSLDCAALHAATLAGLGLTRAFVVHGAEGWDEATPIGPFTCFDVRMDRVTRSVREPAEFGLARCTAADLRGGDAAHNAAAIRLVFGGQKGPHRDALILGAALALEVTGVAASPLAGAARAAAALDDGRGARLLAALAAFARPEAAHA